jgi:hypothetical protein
MKSVFLGRNQFSNCEGVSRRDMLKVGALGFFGLTLPELLAARQAAAAAAPKAESVNVLWCAGGPSHLDTFDPKPDATSDIRGQFNAIETNVSGIRISEHLPNTAKVTDKLAIIRSVTSNIAAHEQASQFMMTGYRPLPTLQYPSYGAVIAKELGSRNNLPPYIAIPDAGRAQQSGFIGAGYNPFLVPDPSAPAYKVQDINPPTPIEDERQARRRGFSNRMNSRFVGSLPDDNVKSVDKFYEAAYDLVNSTNAKKAFDVSAESAETRDLYGRTTYGQGALVARRIVESGGRFVTVQKGGWDTHTNVFQTLSNRLLPELDKAFAGLITDLSQRGMLDKTLVMLMGEFGRTPRVNPRGGRDHWSRCRFAVMAGAGIRGGQVIGKSDDQGGVPAERPINVEDIATSLYTALGIDYNKQYITPTGRPIHLATGGEPIKELWG